MIGNRRRREKSRDLEPAVAVRRPQHCDLDAHLAQSGDALRPVSFDRRSPFELEAELGEKRDGGIEGFHHDADVVHPLKRHAATLVWLSLLQLTGGAHQVWVAPSASFVTANRRDATYVG